MEELNILNFNDNYDIEKDDGNIEYKRELTNLDNDTFNKRVTQMKYRLCEGVGEAFYFIGVNDDGTLNELSEAEYIESEYNLKKIADEINCSVIKIQESNKNNKFIGKFLIRENNKNNYININISIAGNVDAGKSTIIGVLTRGILDDGKGKSRLHVFNYKHEIDTGRTSSISQQIMGFSDNGDVISTKYDNIHNWSDIINQSTKLIYFYDLAGHKKYLKTTIFGLTSLCSDYCLILINANSGINHMTMEHIGICINLKIPFIIVVTKMDITPINIINETMTKINNICKNKIKKTSYIIKNITDVINIAKNIKNNSLVPIIQISSVTGYNIDLLKKLLNLIPQRNNYQQNNNKHIELVIADTYSVIGHPLIISGMLKSGTIRPNNNLLIGPFHDLSYRQVKVRSMHLNCKNINEGVSGNYLCISLKGITRKEIRKGMILITDDNSLKIAIKRFIAEVYVLHSTTTIKEGYQPFVHIEHVRQTIKIIEINKFNAKDLNDKHLRTGDKANVKFEFIIRPEYIKVGMHLIAREGNIKLYGKITEIIG